MFAMPVMRHPNLPDQPIDATDEQVAEYARAGWKADKAKAPLNEPAEPVNPKE